MRSRHAAANVQNELFGDRGPVRERRAVFSARRVAQLAPHREWIAPPRGTRVSPLVSRRFFSHCTAGRAPWLDRVSLVASVDHLNDHNAGE